MGGLFVQMQDCRYKIISTECFPYLIQTIPAPFIQFAGSLYTFHILRTAGQHKPQGTNLLGSNFASDTCMFYPILDCFRPVVYAIGKMNQFFIQVCAGFIRVFGSIICSMCADVAASLPDAFLILNTAYPILGYFYC